MRDIASTFKITIHKERLKSYLRKETIFPVTLEMDLTSVCNRKCPDCASTTNLPSYNLETKVIDRLFSLLEGQTRGLLLTGGEPTMAPNFPEILRMARKYGFVDVVVVTNGYFLNEERIASALLMDASAVRVSLYDWNVESCEGLYPVLKKIETLRSRIDREGSKLQIGVSALTSRTNTNILEVVSQKAQLAGAHWIYFHPLCSKWNSGSPLRVDQHGVYERIGECKANQTNGFRVFAFDERYEETTVEFNGYHTAHFLLVIGADGMNYLGAEVKYQQRQILANITDNWSSDFLWKKERLGRIQAVNSRTYPAIGSRHRGVLYNNLIEQLMPLGQTTSERLTQISKDTFLFPHIL